MKGLHVSRWNLVSGGRLHSLLSHHAALQWILWELSLLPSIVGNEACLPLTVSPGLTTGRETTSRPSPIDRFIYSQTALGRSRPVTSPGLFALYRLSRGRTAWSKPLITRPTTGSKPLSHVTNALYLQDKRECTTRRKYNQLQWRIVAWGPM
ncbi:hypothetical protein DPEC_G00258120 [Dallia pectoralis]|uniref:Uncharacterized protein n=1 Tax=Dallia pectoralis TaxID=75939 RepID=A0ACC2FR09_DALPE|nr:hypothetical protein DPEC_G00258120 [Dallia pectoralis]